MRLDLLTVKVMTEVTLLVVTLATMVSWKINRPVAGMRLFALGLFSFCLGSAMVMLRLVIPVRAIVVIADALVVAGMVMAIQGIRELREFPRLPGRVVSAAVAAVAGTILYWTYVDENYGMRVAVISIVLALLAADAAASMIRRVPVEDQQMVICRLRVQVRIAPASASGPSRSTSDRSRRVRGTASRDGRAAQRVDRREARGRRGVGGHGSFRYQRRHGDRRRAPVRRARPPGDRCGRRADGARRLARRGATTGLRHVSIMRRAAGRPTRRDRRPILATRSARGGSAIIEISRRCRAGRRRVGPPRHPETRLCCCQSSSSC